MYLSINQGNGLMGSCADHTFLCLYRVFMHHIISVNKFAFQDDLAIKNPMSDEAYKFISIPGGNIPVRKT